MTNRLDDEVQHIVANMDNQEQQSQEQETQPEQTIHVHYFPDAIVILKEEEQAQVVDSTPLPVAPQQDSFRSAYAFVCVSLVLIVSTIAFQLYCVANPPVATVTIIPTSHQVMLSGTMQLGRVLPPLTISQSQTAKTTGTGHQDAKAASGTVTFYNGLFTQQFVARGTVYTRQDGVAIVTTQDAPIPPGNPTTGYGTVTVTAQAQEVGVKGNIPAGDINITINNGLLVRNNLFYGGQDERDYRSVTKSDISHAATPLKVTIAQSINGALTGQLKANEALITPSCTIIITSNHQSGDEATQVKVTVSETCSAVAYNSQQVESSVTKLLTAQAEKKLGAGYSLLGEPQVHITKATAQNTKVVLSYQSQSTWIYALSNIQQKVIKKLIAGKNTTKALQTPFVASRH